MQILHLRLTPVGLGNWVLAARELLIERMGIEYPSGTLGVLFKSCNQHISETSSHRKTWWSWLNDPIEAHVPTALRISSMTSIVCLDSGGWVYDLALYLFVKGAGNRCAVDAGTENRFRRRVFRWPSLQTVDRCLGHLPSLDRPDAPNRHRREEQFGKRKSGARRSELSHHSTRIQE